MTEAEARAQEAVVEAVLFTMGRSVETRELAAALECADAEAEAAARPRQRHSARIRLRTTKTGRIARLLDSSRKTAESISAFRRMMMEFR